MRTTIYLPERQIDALDRICMSRKLSRAELIREVVDRYLQKHVTSRDEAFGLWKRAGYREDGVAYQRRVRKEY